MEYRRDLKILGDYDVVVAGGGPAGFTASIQAARSGAKTALIERSGMLGGTITTGGNPQIALFYAHGKKIISGIGWEFVSRLSENGWARIPDFDSTTDHSVLGVDTDPFMAARLMDEMCLEAGVELFLFHQVADALTEVKDGEETSVKGVVVNSKEGLAVIRGKVFIDCTGDADLSYFAGAQYDKGETDENGKTELQPGTLRFYLSGYDESTIDQEQANESFLKALDDGKVKRSDHWPVHASAMNIFRSRGNNINHINFDSSDSKSRTLAEIEGRRSVERILRWAKEDVINASSTRVEATACEVASRESRRVVCDHRITVQEYLMAAKYPDGIANSFYPVDLHRDGHNTLDNIFLDEGKVPSIPYSSLTVKGMNNLLAAGRCICSDRLANSALRVKASCMAMGQAAGMAGSLAALENKGIRDIDVNVIKRNLRDSGAILPENL